MMLYIMCFLLLTVTTFRGVSSKQLSVDISGLTVTDIQGQSVMFTCMVTGSGTITVMWIGPTGDQLFTNLKYTVGAYDLGTRQSTLKIKSLTTADAGTYTCQGSDSSGTKKDFVTQLTVIHEISVQRGKSVTLFENVDNLDKEIPLYINGDKSYTNIVIWMIENGTSTPYWRENDQKYRKIFMDNQTIRINDVDENYEGKYSIPNSKYPEVELCIHEPLSVEITNGLTVTAMQGQSIMLTCMVTGSGTINVMWIGPNGPLAPTILKYTVGAYNSDTRRSTLTIKNLTASDAGTYTCCGTDSSAILKNSVTKLGLAVIPKPVVTIHLPDLIGFPGQDIRVNCTVTSTGSVTVTWYVNDTALTNAASSPGSRFSWQNSSIPSLIVSKAVESDTGIYRCQAQNINGTSSDTVQLTVKGVEDCKCDSGMTASNWILFLIIALLGGIILGMLILYGICNILQYYNTRKCKQQEPINRDVSDEEDNDNL